MRNLQLLCIMWYDGRFLKLNGTMLMKWLSEQLKMKILCFIVKKWDGRSWKQSKRRSRFSKCVVNKILRRAIRYSFIAEIMVPYAWCQMLLQICSIIIEFYLSIAYHAYCFVLGSCQKYLHHDKLSMNDRLSDVRNDMNLMIWKQHLMIC